jgi:CDP-paratose 2-epimerase
MSYIVTGTGGLIGSAVACGLMDLGHEVIGVDNNARAEYFGPEASTQHTIAWLSETYAKQYSHYPIDIAHQIELERLLLIHKRSLDGVIHCAAQPSHDWAATNVLRDFEVNATATVNLLRVTHMFAPESKFVLLSTNKVYGDNPNKLEYSIEGKRFVPASDRYKAGFHEGLNVDNCLHSYFGCSKLTGDMYAQEFARNAGMDVMVLRGGCLSGKGHQGAELHGFLSYLMKTAIKGDPYTVYGYDGYQVRDNVDASDVFNAIAKFLFSSERGLPVVYNIGGGLANSISVLEAIDLCQDIAGTEIPISFAKGRTGDHKWWVTDTSLLNKAFGWEPTVSIENMLLQMHEEYSRE